MTAWSTAIIIPNTFRPQVPARDRLTCWLTPFGIDHLNSLATLVPSDVILQARFLLSKSVTPNTLNTYAAGLLRFTQFCDEYRIPKNLHMPASEDLLVLFVSARGAFKVSAGTIKQWLLGLEFWHVINGAPWHGASALKHIVKVLVTPC